MSISVPELSARLHEALDSEFNVIDRNIVNDVISRLEVANVTRELLETTRIAKTVNELRRKTSDDALKKRAKNLLKRWREAVIPGQAASTQSSSSSTPRPATQVNRVNVNGVASLPAVNRVSAPPGRPSQANKQLQAQQRLLMQQQRSGVTVPVVQKTSSLNSSAAFQPTISSNSSNSSSKISPSKLAALHKENNQLYLSGDASGRKGGQFFHHHLHNNNNNSSNNNNSHGIRSSSSSLPVPSSSSNHLYPQQPLYPQQNYSSQSTVRLNAPVEIINLTDDRSNSPSMFQRANVVSGKKRPRSKSPATPSRQQQQQLLQPSASVTTGLVNPVELTPSANRSRAAMDTNSRPFSGMLPLETLTTTTSTCDNDISFVVDNDSSSVSRSKHKKHKRDKKSKQSPATAAVTPAPGSNLTVPYNHTNDRSVPNAHTVIDDNSLSYVTAYGGGGSSLPNNLILPDNDSLSNTSASIFNCNNNSNSARSGMIAAQLPAQSLSFAGRFPSTSSSSITDTITPLGRQTSPQALSGATGLTAQLSRSSSPAFFNQSSTGHASAVIAQQSQQQLQSVEQLPPVVQPKQPKKRGRKKGSKGIDSLMAAHSDGKTDSYQDLMQKISSMPAGGARRTKTTKELMAEIQQKRTNSGPASAVTSPSVTQAPSPASSSEISQSTDIGSRLVSPEPPLMSTSSLAVIHDNKASIKDESKLSTVTSGAPTAATASSTVAPQQARINKYEDVELTIKRLQAQLPVLTFKTDSDESDDEPDVPRCTCTLREVLDTDGGGDDSDANNQKSAMGSSTGGSGVDGKGVTLQVPNIEINIVKDSDEELAEAQARERLKGKKKRRAKAPMKSIFDLEDDEVESGSSDDDMEPVPEPDAVNESVISVLVANEKPSTSSGAQSLNKQPAPTSVLEREPLLGEPDEFGVMQFPKPPVYEAVIDPNCAAMKYYETNRNQVTNYHVEALHNYFIPNVNGNWNTIKKVKSEPVNETESSATTTTTTELAQVKDEKESEDEDGVSVDTANKVVPRYNFLQCDKIPKQFADFHYDHQRYLERRLARYEQQKRKIQRRRRLFSQPATTETVTSNPTTTDIAIINHINNETTSNTSPHPVTGIMDSDDDDSDNDHAGHLPPHNRLSENGFITDESEHGVESVAQVNRNGHKSNNTSHDQSPHEPLTAVQVTNSMEIDPNPNSDDDNALGDDEPPSSPPPLSPPLTDGNNELLPSFNELNDENVTGHKASNDCDFSEWYQLVNVTSNDEDLTILPYVVID